MSATKKGGSLPDRYPRSEPCSCDVCRAYCARPGWWTVEQAQSAMDAGYGGRMMLELSPDLAFGVLSPAFRGCEGTFGLQEYASRGCNFLSNGLCELHLTDFMPLECRFCHHSRVGLGQACHAALEQDWHTRSGQLLVKTWLHQFMRARFF